MKHLIFLILLTLSGAAFATNNGGCTRNCNDIPPVGDVNQDQGQAQYQDQHQGQAQSQSADATAVAGAIAGASSESNNTNLNSLSNRNDIDVNTSDYNANLNANHNTNVANGGEGGSAIQGQSQFSKNDNSNSSNNSSRQSTSLVFEGTGKAGHYNRHGNNVNAFAPAIYSSSACTGGGLSGAASAFGMGLSLGGGRQDPQCQVRENARILSGLDHNLAIMYLCANPLVDVGTVLGEACKPPVIVVPPVVVPETKPAPLPSPFITPTDVDVKG